MDMVIKVLGILFGSTVILVPAISYIIKKWQESETENQNLKHIQNLSIMERLKEENRKMEAQMSEMNVRLNHTNSELSRTNSRLSDTITILETTRVQLQTVIKEQHTMNAKFEKYVMDRIGDELYLIKKKRQQEEP